MYLETRNCRRNEDIENPEEFIQLMPHNQHDNKGSNEDSKSSLKNSILINKYRFIFEKQLIAYGGI